MSTSSLLPSSSYMRLEPFLFLAISKKRSWCDVSNEAILRRPLLETTSLNWAEPFSSPLVIKLNSNCIHVLLSWGVKGVAERIELSKDWFASVRLTPFGAVINLGGGMLAVGVARGGGGGTAGDSRSMDAPEAVWRRSPPFAIMYVNSLLFVLEGIIKGFGSVIVENEKVFEICGVMNDDAYLYERN